MTTAVLDFNWTLLGAVQDIEESRLRRRRGRTAGRSPSSYRQLSLSGGGAMHGAIQGIALHGVAPGITNQVLDVRASHSNRSLSSGHVDDLLFDDRAIQVIGSEIQSKLC